MATKKELQEKVDELEERLNSSSLFSDKFWTRAIAVFGHYLSVYLLIVVGVMFIVLLTAGLS